MSDRLGEREAFLGFSASRGGHRLLAKLLANALSSPESCANRYAPFPKNSRERDATATYFSGSSPLIIPWS